jgi:uroporphyrinogen III methyltransferase/synthase
LAAVRAIQRADVVLYDALVHPAVLAHARADASLVFVGKRAGHEGTKQDDINAMLVAYARDGKRVCRLKGGDPFLFGRGSEEAEVLAEAKIPFEVIPGVTAALGATAYAGISLTHRSLSSSVAFLTSSEHASKSTSAHDWSKLATATQTLVIYMGVRKIREEMERLMAFGRAPETPVAVIQWGTRADQRVVVGTVGEIARLVEDAQLGAPALVVIGEVARLRESLQWWDRQPLFGRRVLETRAREQAGGVIEALVERGAEPVAFPAIAFEPPSDPERVEKAVREIRHYDAAVFTSANGVERWFAAMRAARLDARAMAAARVVAIGPATAAMLERYGVIADAVPAEHRGEAAGEATVGLFADRAGIAGRRVLLARAEVAREALPDALRAAGAVVDVVPVYRTVAAPKRDVEALIAALRAGQIDAATFTSSSTVEHVCDALGPQAASLLAPVAIASIGPITSEAARARGLHVTVEAATYTIPGLLASLEAHYDRRSHTTP